MNSEKLQKFTLQLRYKVTPEEDNGRIYKEITVEGKIDDKSISVITKSIKVDIDESIDECVAYCPPGYCGSDRCGDTCSCSSGECIGGQCVLASDINNNNDDDGNDDNDNDDDEVDKGNDNSENNGNDGEEIISEGGANVEHVGSSESTYE